MFTLKQLKYFVEVAKLGSISAAAESLYVSQPGVSAAITQLESMLDVQLFVRRKARGVTLTPAGRSLVVMARELLNRADDVMTQGRSMDSELKGKLRVGFYHTIGPHILPGMLASFSRQYPGVDVSIHEADLAQLHAILDEGDIELAILYDLDLGPQFDHERLLALPPYVLAAANSDIARGDAISIRALADQPMILLDLPHSSEYFRMLFRVAGVEPRIEYKTKSIPMIRSLVANGLGYSILNFQPVMHATYDGKHLAYLRIKEHYPGLQVVIAWLKQSRTTARARAFIDAAQAYVATTSYAAIDRYEE